MSNSVLVEIKRSSYMKGNYYDIRIGDICGSINGGNVTLEEALTMIKYEVKELPLEVKEELPIEVKKEVRLKTIEEIQLHKHTPRDYAIKQEAIKQIKACKGKKFFCTICQTFDCDCMSSDCFKIHNLSELATWLTYQNNIADRELEDLK